MVPGIDIAATVHPGNGSGQDDRVTIARVGEGTGKRKTPVR
jgi:hypothetical protein